MARINIECKCGAKHSIPMKYAGKNIRCKACDENVRIPFVKGPTPKERRTEDDRRKSQRRKTERRKKIVPVNEDRRERKERRKTSERRKAERRIVYVPPEMLKEFYNKPGKKAPGDSVLPFVLLAIAVAAVIGGLLILLLI